MTRVKITSGTFDAQTRFNVTAGCDVDSSMVVVCCLDFSAGEKHLREIPQTRKEARRAAVWLKSLGCQFIVLESTATYHQMFYEAFREQKLNAQVINPLQVKALLRVEGKSDKADAETLALLAATFPLRTSNMPDAQQRQIRDNLRFWDKNRRQGAATRQSVQMRLHGMGIPIYKRIGLATVSGRSILRALAYTTDDAKTIAESEWKGHRARLPELREALEGCEHLPPWFRNELVIAIDELEQNEALQRWREEVAYGHIESFELADQIAWMTTAPGINALVALRLIGEMGQDFWNRYPSARAWAKALGVAPNNIVSAGNVLKTQKALGNRYAKQALLQQMRAWLLHNKDHPLKVWQTQYKARAGFRRSVSAACHHTARSLWFMGKRGGQVYAPQGLGLKVADSA